MSRFHAYRDGFPNALLKRSKSGALEVALHFAGDMLVSNGRTDERFVDLFHAIGSDPDNRVVILTGSGDAFMEAISHEGFMRGKNNEVLMAEASGLVGVAGSELARN